MKTSIRVLVANGPRLFRELVVSTLLKHSGIKIVGEAKNEKDVPSLVAETKPNVLLIALDESRRRPPMCDQLLHKFPGLRIVAVAPNTNLGTLYWASLEIHSTTMGTSKNVLLKVMRDSVSRNLKPWSCRNLWASKILLGSRIWSGGFGSGEVKEVKDRCLLKPVDHAKMAVLTGLNGSLAFTSNTSALSSRGLGHRPLTAVTRVRIPLALPTLS